MGLTAPIELSMVDAGLIDFYGGNVPAFKALATRAYAFAHDNVIPSGLPLRRDDVSISLRTALEINEDLRAFLGSPGKKLTQKFWYERFADLILDRLWTELEDEHADNDGDHGDDDANDD